VSFSIGLCYTTVMEIKSSKKITLLSLLEELSPDSSKNTLRGWLEKGRVTVDGKRAKFAKQTVEGGQLVKVGDKKKFLHRGLKIVYEDEHIVVVDKPAGLLTVATDKETDLTVHAILKRRFNNRPVYPVHRLDRETSGLLVFAYTEKAREDLKGQLFRRTMGREYRALVHGDPGKGVWKDYLWENIRLYIEISNPKAGKLAITHYQVLQKRGDRSLVKFKLETGRKHQIRVQAANAGYPLVGDNKYGNAEDGRLFLHAAHLKLQHPASGKSMSWNSPVYW